MTIYASNGTGSSGIGIGITTTLNLSDVLIYSVATTTLSVPQAKQYADIFILQADLYYAFVSYNIDNIIKSDGTNGGIDGKFYKSLTNGNIGNLLSDPVNWAFADLLGANVGDVEINNFGNPNTLSKYHNSQFETEALTAVTFIPTPPDTPIVIGQIMLPINTPITIIGRSTINDIIVFNIQNGIARYVGSSVN
jgi:hypothetical protein